VDTLRDLFDAAETLDSGLRVHGDRLIILTNGGGLGVIAADALERHRGELARLSPETVAALDRVLPASWSKGNPVDIIGDANGARYAAALEGLASEPAADAILVMNCPTGVSDSEDAAGAVLGFRAQHPSRPILGCWMGEASAVTPRRRLTAEGLPNYETPDEAVCAFLHLREYDRNQNALYETPATTGAGQRSAAAEAVRAILARALSENRSILTEPEAKAALAAYGIPVVATYTVTSAAEAEAAAAKIGRTVALKILSRQITHKSDVGGVRLDLETPGAVRRAAEDMLARVARERGDAIIDGFTIQEMVERPHARELLLGAVIDPTFGPCILFGHGGVATEVIADRTIGLPPLNSILARDMIGRTRISRLLGSYRDRTAADHDAICATLVALSDMMIDLPEIAEMDINPLLADADGVIALDARIVVREAPENPNRLAIRPWPSELARKAGIGDIDLMVRPIRPDDSAALVRFSENASASDLRLRFHGAAGQITEATAARLCQIDYDREMVLVAEEPAGGHAGIVRLIFDPDFETAEVALIVKSDMQCRGLGALLLEEAIDYARSRGAHRLTGDVMSDNCTMLDLARRLGANLHRHPEDETVTRMVIPLQ
jgi:acetyltransferase